MVEQRILDIVKHNISKGKTLQEIREELIRMGLNSNDVNAAFKNLGYSYPIKKVRTRDGFGFLERMKMIISEPSKFFERVKGEEGYNAPFRFYAILILMNMAILDVLIVSAFSVLPSIIGAHNLTAAASINSNMNWSWLMLMVLGVVDGSMIMMLIGIFLGAGIIHIFAILFGAKGGYLQTYKAVVYSSVPQIFIWICFAAILLNPAITFFGIFGIYVWILFLQVIGLSALHDISRARALLVLFAPIILSAFVMIGFLLSVLFSAGISSVFTMPMNVIHI